MRTRPQPPTPENGHPGTPSRRLLGAVLERAMRDAVEPLGSGSTACSIAEQDHVRRWFHDDSVEPMSFRWLCQMLDLDPEAFVRCVAQATKRAA